MPHPTGSTCVHAAAGVHGEGNNHQDNMYNQGPQLHRERNKHQTNLAHDRPNESTICTTVNIGEYIWDTMNNISSFLVSVLFSFSV